MNHLTYREFFAGIFTIIGFACIAILSFRLGTDSFFNESNSYKLYAKFSDIGSLRESSPVKLGGVTIGSVEGIYLDESSLTPKVAIYIDDNIKNIPLDSTLAISTSGLIGFQYLSLELGIEENFFKEGDYFSNTTSAVYLEKIINKFIVK